MKKGLMFVCLFIALFCISTSASAQTAPPTAQQPTEIINNVDVEVTIPSRIDTVLRQTDGDALRVQSTGVVRMVDVTPPPRQNWWERNMVTVLATAGATTAVAIGIAVAVAILAPTTTHVRSNVH